MFLHNEVAVTEAKSVVSACILFKFVLQLTINEHEDDDDADDDV